LGRTTGRSVAERHGRRLAFLFAVTFGSALLTGLLARQVIAELPVLPALAVMAVIIALGVIGDGIGVAVTRAHEPPFRAMAARRLPGARHSLYLLRNADRVASLCSDVIGDIASTVSGAAAIAMLFLITGGETGGDGLAGFMVVAGVAALTVTAKAWGKRFAIRDANTVIRHLGLAMYWGERLLHPRRAAQGQRGREKRSPG